MSAGPKPGRALPRFAFVVHALTPLQRRFMGVRSLQLDLALGRGGTRFDAVTPLCTLRLDGVAEGVVVGIPLDPEQLLGDQERTLNRMHRAVNLAQPVDAVGLGSLCAVVAGRGEGLAERVGVPVTTGAAATAWALHHNVREVLRARGEDRVAVVGAAAPVGAAVARMLSEDGVEVHVDARRGAKRYGLTPHASAEDAVAGVQIVLGAGPTGASLRAEAVHPGSVIVDVAIPDTVVGELPPGVEVLAGEAVKPPPGWHGGFWGRLYQTFAGYGPTQVYACVIEPLVLAVGDRTEPYALGRRLNPETVREFGRAAEALGFQARLARGFRGVAAADLTPDRRGGPLVRALGRR